MLFVVRRPPVFYNSAFTFALRPDPAGVAVPANDG